jgi:phospholipid/cholesterol/gamma-HCH transport system substrate-binding protein
MATRKEKVNAGLFLLIGILMIGATVAVVLRVELERRGDPYLVKIPKSVGGLREGSVVKYLGVHVGRVKEVDPAEDGASVRVLVEITKPQTPIRTGTYATLASNFLTGETSIDLQGGSADQPRLVPGSLLQWRPTTLMRLEDSLPGVVDRLDRIVDSVSALLGEENRARVTRLVDDADRVATDLHDKVGPTADRFQAAADSLAQSGREIAAEAKGLRSETGTSIAAAAADLRAAAKSVENVANKLAKVTDQMEKGGEGLPDLVTSVQKLASRLDALVASADLLVGDNREGLRRTLAQLTSAAREIEALVVQVQRNPSDLVFSQPPPEHERGERDAKPKKGDS